MYRTRFLLPLVARMKEWIATHKDSKEVLTDETLKKAIGYIDSRWDEATCFIAIPYVLPHNNLAEQYFRYLKLGNKNWLFCSSELGAKELCVFYSLIYSAKMVGINPSYYLADIVEQIDVPGVNAAELTPSQWKKHREHLVVPKYLSSPVTTQGEEQQVSSHDS